MDILVSNALNIYNAEVDSSRKTTYFLSLPLDAPDFWEAYEAVKFAKNRVESLKDSLL